MAVSGAYRLLLAGLLPVIAILIYIEGQDYDPALIQFQSAQSSADSSGSSFPGEIAGYRRTGRVRSYVKENLYEYVDGHAEYFISAGFDGLHVGEYQAPGSAADGPDVVVDIYDMGKSIQAFGVLSDESGGNVSEFQNGLMGFSTPQGISFVKGRYYIKIAKYNDDVPLNDFMKSIGSTIGAGSDPFPEFSHLPDIGEVVGTRFIKKAYRGLDFVNNVIEREYNVHGNTVQIFVVPGEKGSPDKLAGAFIEYFRQSDIPYSISEKKGKKIYRIKDPYEGDWVMVSSPDALYGIYGAFDDTIINALLAE